MKKRKTEKVEKEKEKEAEIGKVDIKGILNQELTLDRALILFQENQGPDPGQNRIIEMIANHRTIQDSIGKKKGNTFL